MTTPTLAAELACAARALNALGRQLDVDAEVQRAAWRSLSDEVASCRSDGAARLAVITWRADLPHLLNETPADKI